MVHKIVADNALALRDVPDTIVSRLNPHKIHLSTMIIPIFEMRN